METWKLYIAPELQTDRAIAAAVEDLNQDGRAFGLSFEPISEAPASPANVIAVGDPVHNPLTKRLQDDGLIHLEGMADPQGFEIRTAQLENGRAIVVAGGSAQGNAYGLYWLWDRMRVFGVLPNLDCRRAPTLPIRLTMVSGPEHIRNALRFTATWTSGAQVDYLVPWGFEPEDTLNAENREGLRDLLKVAHDLHIKYLAVSDEFSYTPQLLDEFGATPNPADPAMWKALQAKYTRLFEALPELDGVQIRTGEHTRITGSCKPLDVMHEPVECDWPLDKRYRTFLQKMHEIVVGRFNKIYFHRTWVTNTFEQHSNPEVYKAIFTDEVPTRNLYTSPYITSADRWYYQPYNATFNLTPHAMLALLASQDYHDSGRVNVFPSFSGEYQQGGLLRILADPDTNLRGVHFNLKPESGWDTTTLTAYGAFRFAWEPDVDLRTVAEDFAAIYFGREAAPTIAEMLLLSYRAYEDGIYIKPVAEGLTWNTLPHLRLTTFQVEGYPDIDHGRAHIEWLRTSMADPCKGREEEAITYLDKGLRAAQRMEALYDDIAPVLEGHPLDRQLRDSLTLTRCLVATNNAYVRTCLAYFAYRDDPAPAKRETLAAEVANLESKREAFIAAPGFGYQLFGIDYLLQAAREAVDDLPAHEARLAAAPDQDGVLQAIADHQKRNAEALERLAGRATKFLSWRGKVDGKDILTIRGETLSIEHIQDDPIHSMESRFYEPLPQRAVTILFKDIESQTIHPFILEHPSEENDFALKFFLADRSRGYSWWAFDLYYIDQSPDALGLAPPW